MEMTEREMLQKWVDTWKVTGPLMEQFRADDLARLTEEDRGRMFNEIMLWMPVTPRHDDGLIEQQRHFKKHFP